MTGSQAEALGIGFLLLWLVVETLWDLLKSLVLPIWLVLPPVLAGLVYQAVFGKWYIAAALGAVMILHLSDNLLIRAAGTVLAVAASAAGGQGALAAGVGLYWLLWEANIIGGADGLAAYAVLMVVPRWEMLAGLLVGMFLWGTGTIIAVYRGRLPERAKAMAWRVMLRKLPSADELETEGRPTIGGIWIGTVLYAVWRAVL